ncbi:hypothetical protein PRIPAC_80962 [Pristionchus pacificus]|uniref:Uncharacterized protein n=1 Tax=Pristionchus pacificus TaxID=54126 RepID=A0A454XWQ1_PRIPA|nr:hypothetical protein PRIPAC_80962 [Pristionchus pacificus]|eukprot:PDM72212.1 hypothetical protein PRIPAC_38646 [Pristionchus pacificus]
MTNESVMGTGTTLITLILVMSMGLPEVGAYWGWGDNYYRQGGYGGWGNGGWGFGGWGGGWGDGGYGCYRGCCGYGRGGWGGGW